MTKIAQTLTQALLFTSRLFVIFVWAKSLKFCFASFPMGLNTDLHLYRAAKTVLLAVYRKPRAFRESI